MKTSKNQFLNTYLHRDGEDYKVVVEYHYWPASRGSRGPYGEPLEPDTPAEVEIVNVKILEGEDVEDLTKSEEEQLVTQVFEHVDDQVDWDREPPLDDIDL